MNQHDMHDHQHIPPLQIRTPCPKTWAELEGGGKRRFCSECSLHVHDAAQLTQREALSLVAGTTSRVCMRIEHDASGAPVFLDSRRAARDLRHRPERFVRWIVSAAAGLLAACHGSLSPPTAGPGSGGTAPGGTMGKVSTTLLGDAVAPPQPPLVTLGEVAAPPSSDGPRQPEVPPPPEEHR